MLIVVSDAGRIIGTAAVVIDSAAFVPRGGIGTTPRVVMCGIDTVKVGWQPDWFARQAPNLRPVFGFGRN